MQHLLSPKLVERKPYTPDCVIKSFKYKTHRSLDTESGKRCLSHLQHVIPYLISSKQLHPGLITCHAIWKTVSASVYFYCDRFKLIQVCIIFNWFINIDLISKVI